MGLRTASAVCALVTMLSFSASAQTFTVLHVFNGTPDGKFPAASLVQDAAGNLYGTTESGGADDGTVFKVSKAGHESVLFSFNRTDGTFPTSNLILDKAGNLLGTALGGPGAGVLFRISKNGEQQIIHCFEGGQGADAAVPSGGVISDDAGNLYGATQSGGLGDFPGFGTLYKVDPTGQFTVIYKFRGKADGANPQGSLVRDADGNLYGAAPATDTNGTVRGTIFKLAPDGTFSVLHRFTGGKDGSAPQGSLLLDKAGNLFGSVGNGGDSGHGLLFEITKAGKFKRLYSFTGGKDGAVPNGGLVQDADGNLYGTAQIGPGKFVLGTVFKLSPAHSLTVLHTFKGLKDGAVPLAGLIRDSSGTLYGTTVKN